MKTAHFEFFFQKGAERSAIELASVLEKRFGTTQNLLGARKARRIPIIVNQYSDTPNAFVHTLPFREEVNTSSFNGKILSPRHLSWLEIVGVHETTHALHAEVNPGFGIGWMLGFAGGDLRRTLNFLAPGGFIEGTAVYEESQLKEGAGRLNHAYFNMQFNAQAIRRRPWSLATALERSAGQTWPYDRHYIGGAFAIDWLTKTFGVNVIKDVAGVYNRLPFLGFGSALWIATQRSPWRLSRQFSRESKEIALSRINNLGVLTKFNTVAGGKGEFYYHPNWVDNNTVVAYASGYGMRPAFYQIDVNSGRRTIISHQSIDEDRNFTLSPDRKTIYYSRYLADPIYAGQTTLEAFSLNLNNNKSTQITNDGHVFSTVLGQGQTFPWAIRKDGQFSQWVRVGEDGWAHTLTHYPRANIKEIRPAPNGETVALLINIRGRQGIFISPPPTLQIQPELELLLMFNDQSSIYDITWSPDSRYLLFSSDLSGILNIYAYDLRLKSVVQLTNVAHGAISPSISPDGQKLTFINYTDQQFQLAMMPFDPFSAPTLARETFTKNQSFPWQNSMSRSPFSEWSGSVESYHPEDHLWRPRIGIPFYAKDETGAKYGIGLRGTDPLQQWAWNLDVIQDHGNWGGSARVATGLLPFRPSLSVFDKPVITQYFNSKVDTSGAPILNRIDRRQRGVQLSAAMPLILSNNIFQHSGSFGLEVGWQQESKLSFFALNDSTITDSLITDGFDQHITIAPAVAFGFGLQQNPRDIAPNLGITLRMAGQLDIWSKNTSTVFGTDPLDKAWHVTGNIFLPLWLSQNQTLQVKGSVFHQNRQGLWADANWLPKGYASKAILGTNGLSAGGTWHAPLWHIEQATIWLPIYFKTLYARPFVDALWTNSEDDLILSAGITAGLQFRLFHAFNFNLQVHFSYLPAEKEWITYTEIN